MKIIVDIAGQFTIADQTPEYLAVGFIGSACADRLTPAQLNHVRGFYGMTGKRTEVCPSYPAKLNRNHYNNFDYADRQEITLTPGTPLGDSPDQKQLEERIARSVVVDE